MRIAALALFVVAHTAAIHAQCTTAADVPLAPVRFTPTCGHSVAAIAANPDGALALWSNVHAGFSMITYWMSGTTLDADGHPRRMAEHTYEYAASNAAIATDGRDFLVVTNVNGSVFARVVAGDGTAAAVNLVASNVAGDAPPLVAWNGRQYVIAVDNVVIRAGSSSPLPGRAVALDGNTVIVRTVSGFKSIGTESMDLPIPFDATEVSSEGGVVVWRESGKIRGARAGATSFDIAATAPDSTGSDIAGDLVVWTDGVQTRAARVTGTGVSAPFTVANGTFAAAAFNGIGVIVLTKTSCRSIASTFVRDDAASQTVDVSLAAIGQGNPRIVTTPFGHQIFWRESPAIMTAFVANDGSIGAASRVNGSTSDAGRFVAARAGGDTYVIWSDYPGGLLPGTLRAARFDDGGNAVDTFEIAAGWFFFDLSAASDGAAITLAWTESTQQFPLLMAKAARIAAGAVTVRPVLLTMPDEVMFEIETATDAGSTLVAWRDDTSTLVSVQLDANLQPITRRDLQAPTTSPVFTLAAALDGGESRLAWFSNESDGLSRLHATRGMLDDVVNTTESTFIDARFVKGADRWLLDAEAYDNRTVRLQRTDLATNRVEVLACAPGEFDYTTSGSVVDFMVFAAPQAEAEGAPRLYLRRQTPPRRRASR